MVVLPPRLKTAANARLEDYAERCREAELAAVAVSDLPGDALRVLACSAFVADSICRQPALLGDLLQSGDLARRYEPGECRERLAGALAETDSEDQLLATLRHARRREMVRIAWRDIGALGDLTETIADTSAFADAAIDLSLQKLHAWQCERLGVPRNSDGDEQRLVVIAMGKLGAHELNFSSDIDLLFAYPESGETSGAPRNLSNEAFFRRLGQALINALSATTELGQVFRVDMRLRPFGASGPLVVSFDALEDYYQSHGRDWERYAMIKARVVAGNTARGEELMQRLQPFMYRRYLDFGALESLRDMKQLINGDVERNQLHDNVKLGPGGIREIEFIGQAFQMVRGGRNPDLRMRSIRPVLKRIGERGFLPEHAVRDLLNAYEFLRNTEHRLQQADDRQVHSLPVDPAARERLAAGMGFEDWDTFRRALEKHRQRVRAQFDQVFVTPEESAEANPFDSLWQGAPDDEQAVRTLAGAGFGDAQATWERIQSLKNSARLRALDVRGRGRLNRLMPLLLAIVAGEADPNTALDRVLQVIEAVAGRSAYLALLVERQLALAQLVRLCAASPWIARLISAHPMLLDELLDGRSLFAPLQRHALEADMEVSLAGATPGDVEEEMDRLRQYKQTNVMRVAAADVSGAMPLMIVSDHLSGIAEVVLSRALELAHRDLVERHGRPWYTHAGERAEAGFVIVGYGKLGGLELGYGSDLDLVFLHGGEGDTQQTDGDRQVDNRVFFARLGQRIIHTLTTHTAAGILYETDSRLRPGGGKGLLVSSLDAFQSYQRDEAWTWEHQALVRARVVAGDAVLGERFRAIRRATLLQERDPDRLREEVCDMRERMLRELGRKDPALFDLKQDPGGITDIEFMVQYGALRWASELGEYLEYTDNIRLLEGFTKSGRMPSADTDALADAYRAYRARVHALALQEQPAKVREDEFRDLREHVVEIWRRVMEA